MSVTNASFRRATAGEVQYAKGGAVYQCISYLWILNCKVMGSVEMLSKGSNPLAWTIPYPQQQIEKFCYKIGYNSEEPYIKRLYSIWMNRFSITDKKMMDALFKLHHNGDVFDAPTSAAILLQILKEIFPDNTFVIDDLILTCTEEYTKKFHGILYKFLNSKAVQDNIEIIRSTADKMLTSWYAECQKGKSINVTQQAPLYASSIISQFMFGSDKSSQDIAESFNFISSYLIKIKRGSVTSEDKTQAQNFLKKIKNAIEAAILQGNGSIFKDNTNESLTDAQKKAMIFIIYFAGQETTASLLTCITSELAKNPQAQQNMSDSDLDAYFNKAINKFTPAYQIVRKCKEDTCLEYLLEGDLNPHKVIFFKGESISADINGLAKTINDLTNYNHWNVFGNGKHRCPGSHLAVKEIKEFIKMLLAKYEIDTQQKHSIPIIAKLTSQLAEDIHITLKLRE